MNFQFVVLSVVQCHILLLTYVVPANSTPDDVPDPDSQSIQMNHDYAETDLQWMNVSDCGAGLTCGPDCQLLCLKIHNFYRFLHKSPPLSCDPDLAKSAQEWTDQQAKDKKMYHSKWTDKFTESISWKGWGWKGMDSMQGAIPGAARSWYSEIKNGYNYQIDKGNDQVFGHFKAVVWKGETKLGCGLNIKEGDGTYVTAHYAPASHAQANYDELTPANVLERRATDLSCVMRSTERNPCDERNETLKAPFVTPQKCMQSGCCYDDMFMLEPDVHFYSNPGRTWCFSPKTVEK